MTEPHGPRLIVNWGRGARFTPRYPFWEIGTDNKWRSYRAVKWDSPHGFILHYPHPDGSYVPYHWYVPDDAVARAKRNIRKARKELTDP